LSAAGKVSIEGQNRLYQATMDDDIRDKLSAGHLREAFELLLARYQRKVFRLAYSILGDEAAAEETAQDIFLQIWKVLPGYRGEASLSTWIYVITRNRCLTQRKKIRAAHTASMEEPGIRAQAEARIAFHPERSNGPDIAALIAELPLPYRQALILFYMEEKSYEEVSAMLDLPVGTVKTYLHRARKQMALSFLTQKVRI
jgi:RNA polymerase sigma-70 factor (ECF subfamily)